MVRRRQIQDLEVANVAAPQARPVDTFARPSAAGLSLVQDFAGLSQSITGFLQDKAERDKEKTLAEGRAYAVEHPELAEQWQAAAVKDDPKANRKAFRKLVEDGKIKQLESPWAEVGFQEAAARQLMATYRANVSARIAETAAIVGPDGQPQEPTDIEQVLADEYGKVSANPILQTTYGRNAAVAVKEEIDNLARGASAEARLDAKDANYRSNLTKEMAEKFDQVGMADEVTPDMLQGLSDFVQSAMTETTLKDPRGLVVDALRMSVSRTRRGEGGAEQALLLLEDAENVRVEGLALREDPKASAAIEQLRDDLISQQDRDERAAAVKPDLALKAEIDGREGEWVTRFTDTLDSGGSYAAVVAEEEARVKAEVTDPKLRGNVVQALRQTAKKLEESQSTTPGLLRDFGALIASGDVEGAKAFRDAALADPNTAIIPEDLAAINAELANAASLKPLIEGFAPRNEAMERFRSKEDEFSQYASDVDIAWRQRVRGEVESFNRDYAAFAASVRGQPGAEQQLRDFIVQREAKLAQETGKFQEEQTKNRQEFLDTVREQNAKGVDTRELIERNFRKGRISSFEKEAALIENEKAVDRTHLYSRPTVKAVEDKLFREALNEGDTPQDFERASDAVIQFRRQLDLWIDDNRAKTDPRQFPRSLDGAVGEIAEQVTGTTPEAEAAEEALEAGKTTTEAAKASADLALRRAKIGAWTKRLADPTPIKGDEPIVGRHPNVSRDAYAEYGKFVQRRPGNIRFRSEVSDRFAAETFKLKAAQNPEADKAAMSMYRLLGVPAQAVLDGKMTVQRSEDFATTSESAKLARKAQDLKKVGLSRLRGNFNAFGPQDVDDLIAKHRTLVDEKAEIKITPEDIDPYATPLWSTPKEMRAFMAQRPEDMEKLREMFGIPDDTAAVREWLQSQVDSMNRNRINPLK